METSSVFTLNPSLMALDQCNPLTHLNKGQYNDTKFKSIFNYENIIKWRHFPRYWPFVRGIPGEFPAQRPVTRSFDVFFDLGLNKRLSKQSWGWWFETPSRSLWRHRNDGSVMISIGSLNAFRHRDAYVSVNWVVICLDNICHRCGDKPELKQIWYQLYNWEQYQVKFYWIWKVLNHRNVCVRHCAGRVMQNIY